MFREILCLVLFYLKHGVTQIQYNSKSKQKRLLIDYMSHHDVYHKGDC